MKRCQDCGSVMEDGFRFCPQCAAPADDGAEPVRGVPATRFNAHYCGKCGAKLPAGSKVCLICGVRAGEAPPDSPPPPQEAVAAPKAYSPRKNRTMSRTAIFLSLLLVFTAAGYWAWDVVPYLISTDKVRADNAILYVKNGDTLRIKSADATEALTIAGYALNGNATTENMAQASRNGGYLAYLNGVHQDGTGTTGDLYLLDLGRMTRRDAQGEEGTLISTGVTDSFAFSTNDNYLVFLSREGGLYVYDFHETIQLDSDVDGIFDVNDRQVLYYKTLTRSADERRSVLEVSIHALNGSSHTAVGEVNHLLDWTEDFEHLLYTSGSRMEGGFLRWDVTAYHKAGEQRSLIAVGVEGIVDANAAQSAVLYLRRQEYEMRYEDFIRDDMEQMDGRMQPPEMSRYPALEEYYATFREFPEEWSEQADGAEEQSDELQQLIQEYQDLRQEEKEYEDMLDRRKLRERVHGEVDRLHRSEVALYELALAWEDGESVYSREVLGLDGEIVVEGSIEQGYALFCTADFQLLEPVLMSELTQEEEWDISPGEMLREAVRYALWYANNDELVGLWTADRSEAIADPFIAGSPESLYFRVKRRTADDSNPGSLFFSRLENELPQPAAPLDHRAQYCLGIEEFDGSVLYFRDFNGSSGSLYAAKDGSFEELSYNVYANSGLEIHNGGKTLLFLENYNSITQSGDFYMFIQYKRQITTDVSVFYYRGDDLIYLLKNLREGKGDLYAYSGGVLTLIDSGVTHVLPMDRTIG